MLGFYLKRIVPCNMGEKLRRREIKVCNGHVGKENAREKCPLVWIYDQNILCIFLYLLCVWRNLSWMFAFEHLYTVFRWCAWVPFACLHRWELDLLVLLKNIAACDNCRVLARCSLSKAHFWMCSQCCRHPMAALCVCGLTSWCSVTKSLVSRFGVVQTMSSGDDCSSPSFSPKQLG